MWSLYKSLCNDNMLTIIFCIFRRFYDQLEENSEVSDAQPPSFTASEIYVAIVLKTIKHVTLQATGEEDYV